MWQSVTAENSFPRIPKYDATDFTLPAHFAQTKPTWEKHPGFKVKALELET